MAHQSVTIEDVAKAADVSRQTVSRVINHAKNVSASAREKVKKAIDELGYVPNLAARRMGGSRSFVLMVLMERGSAETLALGEMLGAGLDACSPRGFHIMFEQIEAPSPAVQFEEAEALLSEALAPTISAVQPDGVVILPSLDQCSPLLSALKKRGIASACLAHRKEFGRVIPGLDDAAFAEEATQMLVDLGHRQVGFVPGGNDASRSGRRIEGYRRKLAQVGSRAQRHFVADPILSSSEAIALARSWLTPTIRPTGVIAETAQSALAFAQVARELRIAVPAELSIIALEETRALAAETPAICALHLPYGDLFAAACERLMDASGDQEQPKPGSAFSFAERGSVAKAPRAV
jgi:LacI family transcriptional regulator, galactose operon repressor